MAANILGGWDLLANDQPYSGLQIFSVSPSGQVDASVFDSVNNINVKVQGSFVNNQIKFHDKTGVPPTTAILPPVIFFTGSVILQDKSGFATLLAGTFDKVGLIINHNTTPPHVEISHDDGHGWVAQNHIKQL
jgi:hypothetical protein